MIKLEPVLSKTLAVALLAGFLAIGLVHPFGQFMDAFSQARTIEARVKRLEATVSTLIQTMPEEHRIDHAVSSMPLNSAEDTLIQQLRSSAYNLKSLRVTGGVPESLPGGWFVISASLEGRGDLIEIDEVLSNLSASDLPLSLENMRLTAFGQRRADDEIFIEAKVSLIILTQGR